MNVEKTLLFTWIIWYLYSYGPRCLLSNLLINVYYILDNFFVKYNQLIYPDYWDVFSDSSSELSDDNNNCKVIAKDKYEYEDKYKNMIRQLPNKWQFTVDEIREKEIKFQEFYVNYIENIRKDIIELYKQINDFKKEMNEDTASISYIESFDEDGDELIEETTIEERNEYRTDKIKELTDLIQILTDKITTEDGLCEIKNDAENQSYDYIADKQICNLNNCYVMEKTPQSNVLMMYDKERKSFKYYADSNIPYRHLEVVSRKYVKLFNCRPLFIDMDEEIRLVDEKWTKEYELKKANEVKEKLKREEESKSNKPITQKKNIFAKFKSYNKNAGMISMAAPPKNSIPNNSIVATKEHDKILLKERANRYTYAGKFANFNFLQKIDKKMFNKKLDVTFADFKKMTNKS